MSNKQSPIEKISTHIGKWLLGTISTVTAIVSFVNLMRGNFNLGFLILIALIVGNLLLIFLYVIFNTKPVSNKSKQRVFTYKQYRIPAIAGIIVLLAVVGSALSDRSNREFISVAFIGTSTVTAAPTATSLPPETTMLVTVTEKEPCFVHFRNIISDVVQKETLDIGINNNSDRDLMITSVTLNPIWITASQWMGETGISATYDVSVDQWWSEAQELLALRNPYSDSFTPEPTEIEKIAKVGFMTWVKPSPIEVKDVTKNKFTIKSRSQDRFQIVLGLSKTYQFLWGTLYIEIKTDAGQTLRSEPLRFAVCYAPGIPENPATSPDAIETAVQNPESARNDITWFAWNDAAKQDSGGVSVEVLRVVVAETAKAMDFQWDEWQLDNETTSGEIFLKIDNKSDTRWLIMPSEMEFSINPAADMPFLDYGLGQSLDGYIEPGQTKIGSFRFSTTQPVTEIDNLIMDLGCAFDDIKGCSGPNFVFDIDLTKPSQDVISEEIKQFISP